MKALRGDPLTNTMRLDMHSRHFANFDSRFEALEKLVRELAGVQAEILEVLNLLEQQNERGAFREGKC